MEHILEHLLTIILETSEAEDDVFSDAQEARKSNSGRSSPLPTTKVEKVNPPTPLVFLSIWLNVARSIIRKAMNKQQAQPLTREEDKALCQ